MEHPVPASVAAVGRQAVAGVLAQQWRGFGGDHSDRGRGYRQRGGCSGRHHEAVLRHGSECVVAHPAIAANAPTQPPRVDDLERLTLIAVSDHRECMASAIVGALVGIDPTSIVLETVMRRYADDNRAATRDLALDVVKNRDVDALPFPYAKTTRSLGCLRKTRTLLWIVGELGEAGHAHVLQVTQRIDNARSNAAVLLGIPDRVVECGRTCDVLARRRGDAVVAGVM
jgi:hypothetical protein